LPFTRVFWSGRMYGAGTARPYGDASKLVLLSIDQLLGGCPQFISANDINDHLMSCKLTKFCLTQMSKTILYNNLI
jgi:hypothetical protein